MPYAIRLLIVGWCACNPLVGSELTAKSSQRDLSETVLFGRFESVGSSSCSATACHGSVHREPNDTPGIPSEYHIWRQHDPHARAGWKLGVPLSQQILRDLDIVQNGQIVDHDGFANCLNCHAPQNATAAQSVDFTNSYSLSRGVGCESCHGGAEKWLAPHARSDWQSINHDDLGMFDTKSLLVRARVCVDCHVGSPNRSVNHDLIAAGHPVLQFELTQYHNRLPKHWHDDKQATASFQTQLWWAGQLATGDAASFLLESRVERKGGNSTWPELSEFNCAGCHQSFSSRTNDSPLVELNYRQWNFAVLPQLASRQSAQSQSASKFFRSSQELAAEMKRMNRSDHSQIAQMTRSLRRNLNVWGTQQFDILRQRADSEISQQLADIVPENDFVSSDKTTQLLLAIVAVQRYQKNNQANASWRSEVDLVCRQLHFPAGLELPDWPSGNASDAQPQKHLQNTFLRLLR